MLRPSSRAPAPRISGDPSGAGAVVAALDTVLDPELDEPVTSMGFIESVAVDEGAVEVVFRLPTFWCSANFAFLMAADMRCAVEQLAFVRTATIRLVDHFAARKINRGVAGNLAFGEVFAGEAHGNLDEIRRAFAERAFLGRQDRLLTALVSRWGVEAALATTMDDLRALAGHDDEEVRLPAIRYLALRQRLGGGVAARDPAFTTLDREPIEPARYDHHRRAARRVRGAAEANAEMCRIYLEARTTHPAPGCGPEHREENEDDG